MNRQFLESLHSLMERVEATVSVLHEQTETCSRTRAQVQLAIQEVDKSKQLLKVLQTEDFHEPWS
ncbi:MAG: hypothetical protein ACFBSC_13130 [Microcoleaceae cyanobacterium]